VALPTHSGTATGGRALGPNQASAAQSSTSYSSLPSTELGERYEEGPSLEVCLTPPSNDIARVSSAESSENSTDRSPGGNKNRVRRFDSRSFVPERENSEISKRYEIDARPLAVGGYGQVFVAKDLLCRDRIVAIKKLVKREDGDEAWRSEVKIMKDLDHPSICKLFETYTQGRFVYFVIEYLEGGDLCDRIMEHRRLEEGVSAYIMRQVCGALQHAHALGIAHRDMKPENVCFCNLDPDHKRYNRLKVIDWGLGKHFSRMRMKSSVGSGTFTAPEVLDPPYEGAVYTAACDLWSLGILAYVTLSGKAPFWGSPVQMLRKMREETYPLRGPVWDNISDHAKDFVTHLLKANPEERLPCSELMKHPWVNQKFVEVSPRTLAIVLSNVEHFSHAPHFLAVCVASIAKQLDHRSLDNVYEVFSGLDENGDGSLSEDEVRAGFALAFGENSEIMEEVHEIFARLDLDGTGRLLYTEFCAAAIGESGYTQEHVLWAAFKSFDIHDNGKITLEGLQQVLLNADVTEGWSQDVCEDVAAQVIREFACAEGHLGFQEWINLMRQCTNEHSSETPKKRRCAHLVDNTFSNCEGPNGIVDATMLAGWANSGERV